MRAGLVTAAAVAAALTCARGGGAYAQVDNATGRRIGPSFPCPAPRDPLAQLVCSGPELSEADLNPDWFRRHKEGVAEGPARAQRRASIVPQQVLHSTQGVCVLQASFQPL